MKKKIGQVSARNGLLFLDADLALHSTFSFKQCNKFDIRHSRLDHPSRSHFDFIVKNSKSILANKEFICDVCPRDK